MNDSPDTPAALTSAQVDELLSADLDGEFDAAAADLGFTSDAARELLEAVPGVAARRDALRTAQSLLATAPDLDELQDARMRAAALAAATDARVERTNAGRRHRMLYSVAGIAAVLVGAVALVSVVSHSSTQEKSSSVAAAPAQTPSTPTATTEHGAPLNYGDYANAQALVLDLRARKGLPGSGDLETGSGAQSGASAPVAVGTQGNDRYTFDSSSQSLAKCSPVALKSIGGTASTPRGTALVAGKPVSIYVIQGSPPVAYIFSSDCKLLLRQVLG